MEASASGEPIQPERETEPTQPVAAGPAVHAIRSSAPDRKIYGSSAMFGLMLALTAMLWLRGSLLHLVVGALATLFIGLPALAVGIVAFFAGKKWAWRWIGHVRRIALGAVIVVLIQLASIPVGMWVGAHDVQAAKTYCEKLVVLLDEEHHLTGRYPASVDELIKQAGPPPHLLRARKFYEAADAGYEFSFSDNRDFGFEDWWYSSKWRSWVSHD